MYNYPVAFIDLKHLPLSELNVHAIFCKILLTEAVRVERTHLLFYFYHFIK